jgi:hypothetical protein
MNDQHPNYTILVNWGVGKQTREALVALKPATIATGEGGADCLTRRKPLNR